ncbi:MAG: SPOR domain-containing protein, partial [Thermodesulfobacteriota bacterium]
MAERRYNFRFSLPEGCVILASLFLTSFLIFLFGVHVGKETQARKAVQQGRTVRVPVALTDSERATLSASAPEVPLSGQRPTGNSPGAARTEPQLPRLSSPTEHTRELTTPAVPAAPVRPAPAAETAREPTVPLAPPKAVPPVSAIDEKKPAPQLSPKGRWSVQVHATRQQSAARDIAQQLREQGYTPVVNRI